MASKFRTLLSLSALSTLALSGALRCSEPLPSPSLIAGLRILALRGTPTAGSPTRVEAIVAQHNGWSPHPDDAGRTPRVDWFLCDTRLSNDATACVQSAANLQWIAEGTSVEVSNEWLSTTASRVLFATYCYGQRAAWLTQRSSLGCPDEASRPYAQTEGVVAFKVLQRAAPNSAPNQNPEMARILINNESSANLQWNIARCVAPNATDCPSVSVVVVPAANAAESITDSTREVLTVSFYALSGRFDRPRAVANTAAPNGEDQALSARWTAASNVETTGLAVVLRDDRGGVSVVFGELVVR